MKTVSDVFSVPAYRRVNAEDGAYEAYCGNNVIARCNGDNGCSDYYLYVGPEGGELPYLFVDSAGAAMFVARVRTAGRIDDTAYWYLFESTDPTELPDYALNPGRPEYN